MTKSTLTREEALVKARELMHRHIVVDGLAMGPAAEWFVEDLIKGGMNAVNNTVGEYSDSVKSAFMRMLAQRWLVKRIPDKCILVSTTTDINQAKREGKVAIINGWQGAEPLLDDYRWIEVFQEFGLRILQFTYNHGNLLGAGCLEPRDGGLTFSGIEMVRACNERGIVTDCSHAGERTSLDMIERSDKPCIFSHSNPSGVRNNPRNISDEQIKACATRGGVIGCTTFADFVGDTAGGRQPTLKEWVKCVDYVVKLVGIDHVGIGGDISCNPGGAVWWDNDTKRRYPEICGGMTFNIHQIEGLGHSHANFSLLVAALLESGYGDEDIAKILGRNWLRVFDQVWGA